MSKKINTQEELLEKTELEQIMDESLKDLFSVPTQEDTVDEPTVKRSKFVFIRHNASENYRDPNKAAYLGDDLYPGGFSRKMELASIERGNRNQYLSGLNPKNYTSESDLTFLEKSRQTLKEIFGEEVLDEFNDDFWSKQFLIIDSEETVLDLENPEHLVTYWAIKGGGYPYVAPSQDATLSSRYRFYLHEPHIAYMKEDTSRLVDKAIRQLSEIDESADALRKLFFLHKILITANEGVTNNTPKPIIYDSLKRFINGDYGKGKKSSAVRFTEAVILYNTDQKRAVATAIVKDAIHYGCLTTNTKGKYVNTSTGFKYETGDEPKVIEMVMNPAHQEEMMNLLAEVTKKWNKF
jgi:hypothetical protein